MKKIILIFFTSFLLTNLCFAKSSVWKISKDENILYIGGSVHILRAEDYPLPEEFETAFTECSILVLEADMDQLSKPEIIQYISTINVKLPDGETLKTVLDEETYLYLAEKCNELGIHLEEANTLKPSIIVNLLTMVQMQKLGFQVQGVDFYFRSKAKEESKETGFLETVDFQIDLLFNIGEGFEDEYLLYSIKDMDNLEEDLPAIVSGWRDGNAGRLEQEMLEMKEDFPTVYKKIFTDRNEAWIPLIENYLAGQETAFVIVGAAHLYGKEGLLEQLKNKGYQIEQLE